MAISRGMRRLLGVLEAEEERYRAELATALEDLRRLEQAFERAGKRQQEGRRLVWGSAISAELIERLAGLEEARAGWREAESLKPKIAGAQAQAKVRRQEFLNKRTERQQVNTIVESAEMAEALEAGRRGQRLLDDWFLSKVRQSAIADRKDSSELNRPAEPKSKRAG
jgi:hypothetical protein